MGSVESACREWDPEIGLYYYRARYYDPKIGRFISEDPIDFLGGINFYTYVGNDPSTLADPFGLVDLNLFEPGSRLARLADRYDKPGYFTIAAHGREIWDVLDYRGGGKEGVRLLPEALFEEMKKAGWTEGTPVELIACQMGTGEGYFDDVAVVPYGQVLADVIRARVEAPENCVFWHETTYGPRGWDVYGKKNGRINPQDPGIMVPFAPR